MEDGRPFGNGGGGSFQEGNGYPVGSEDSESCPRVARNGLAPTSTVKQAGQGNGVLGNGHANVGEPTEHGRSEAGHDQSAAPETEMGIGGGPDLREHEASRERQTIKPRQILALLKKQDYRCAYTGDLLTPDEVGADHVIPISKGGPHQIENIALVTQAVNTAKGTMTLDEFISMCRKVVRTFGTGEESA